jgi:hypothetical protein
MANSRTNTVPTSTGHELMNALLLGIPHVIRAKSTLNEKLNIQAGVQPVKTPTLNYFAIGNRGHAPAVAVQGIALMETVRHLPTDGGLYGMIPFALRALDNDLTLADRAKYALRKIITVGSTSYIAYYLKRLDKTAATVSTKLITKVNGAVSEETFTPTDSSLSPTPRVLSAAEENVLRAQYCEVTSPLPLNLSAAEAEEILNACAIIFGDESLAFVTEMALCSGEDKTIQLSDQSSFVEAVGVQVCSFSSLQLNLKHQRGGIGAVIDVGSSSPMLASVTDGSTSSTIVFPVNGSA